MKFTERIFKDCGGRCCICGNVYICANVRENTFEVASKEELIRRVDNEEFPFNDAFIVGYLFGKHGYKYGENQIMEVCCAGNNCSKKERCKVYKNNYWEYHNDVNLAQYEDWSNYGSCAISQNVETGETIVKEEVWCGDLSKDYKFFKEIPNK